MKVYRVYEAFHNSSESGTKEYGVFSTPELAKARVAEIWRVKKYPDGFEEYPSGGRYVYDGWDGITVRVEEIEVDKSVDEQNIGYT